MKFISFENNSKFKRHQSIIKESNIKQLFDLVFENEGISRIEISRLAGLSRSTVSLLIDELMDAGLIKMTGERESDSSGRKPIGLEINGNRAQIIALSLQKDFFNCIVYNIRGKELDSFREKITYKKGCALKIWGIICSKLKHLDPPKLLAVCVSVPAKINKAEKSINLSILDTDENFNLPEEFKKMRPGLPLVIVNQSSACVYAEYKTVYKSKIRDMIYFNIDDGVGAGIMVNGSVFAGEIGHMSIDNNGPLCICGKKGCLENSVSKSAVLKEFTVRASKNKIPNISYRTIREALDNGDKATLRAAGEISAKIALGISNVICMFNPEKIIIGGSIIDLGKTFLDMVLEKIEMPGSNRKYLENSNKIVPRSIDKNADQLGILHYFLDKVFTISTEMEDTIHFGD
ncbi:xylose repressor [Spirochaetia bacterium]|nr:xylose repressor [Spirochaetia bacterium]